MSTCAAPVMDTMINEVGAHLEAALSKINEFKRAKGSRKRGRSNSPIKKPGLCMCLGCGSRKKEGSKIKGYNCDASKSDYYLKSPDAATRKEAMDGRPSRCNRETTDGDLLCGPCGRTRAE